MGVHESQSLLWERMVALSRPFSAYLAPKLQAAFPQLPGFQARIRSSHALQGTVPWPHAEGAGSTSAPSQGRWKCVWQWADTACGAVVICCVSCPLEAVLSPC